VVVQRFTRALTRATTMAEIGELAMRAMGRLVRAQVGSLAVQRAGADSLSIVATLGYPRALVDHVRVGRGSGILGAVYQSGIPLRVNDVTAVPGVRVRRPRYRTAACMAWPLKAGADVIGVLSASDRYDERPFSVDDMAAMRALAAPLALAVSRESVRSRMEELAQAAAIDPLTGLFNRRYFHQRLAEELERAQRHGMAVALAMIDLDGFKQVNDVLGHLLGDAVIREVANMLRGAVRVFDICVRFGGDEFVIVMPEASSGDAHRIADRIRARIATQAFGGALAVRLTASVGVAVARSDSPGDLVALADRALYDAKRQGGDRVSEMGVDG
jgi:diguanylate cyclase (GGDEF)-like protein